MYIFLIILILLASALLVLTVLAQNPKSGMAANFGASNQVMGVRQTSDFLEKFTWTLAVAILVLSLAATMAMPSANIARSKSGVEKAIERAVETPSDFAPGQLGTFPTQEGGQAPAGDGQQAPAPEGAPAQ